MSFAHVTDGTIDRTGPLPKAARRLDTQDWVLGLRNASVADQQATGWHEIVKVDQPADTDTTTHDRTIELVDGTPTVVWTERDLTQDEIDARNEVPIETRLAALEAKEARLAALESKVSKAETDIADLKRPTPIR